MLRKEIKKIFVFLPFEVELVLIAYCLYVIYVNLLIRFKVNKACLYL